MLELRPNPRNKLPIDILVNGKLISFNVWYATPKTSQKVAFESARTKFKKGKMHYDGVTPSVHFGLELLAWVEDGVLTLDGKSISTDPASPDYDPNWKKVLGDLAAENASIASILIAVATAAFDNVKITGEELDIETEGEESPPLPKS
jgi:hypothetical protein